tara:strand:- start:317 stop:892 length:576 start_codon:yes stop_codon:yes gene_type:complete
MQIIPGVANSITRINTLIYTCGTAVHAVTIMRPVATTITDVAAATGQPVIEVTDAVTMKAPNTVTPEPLAGPDYLAWIDSTGKFQYDTVSSITSNAVTMTGNLSASIAAGQTIWIFGEVGRVSHMVLKPPVSATTVMQVAVQGGVPGQLDSNSRAGVGDPLMVYSNNPTTQGWIVSVSGEYITDTSDITMT